MNKSENIKKHLKSLVSSVDYPTFLDIAPDKTPFPYIVYDYRLTKNENIESGQLEINVWDIGEDTSTIDLISDDLQVILDKYLFVNDDLYLTINKGLRMSVPDENKQIKRRRLLFELKIME